MDALLAVFSDWPHLLLLGGATLGSALVGIGILKDSKEWTWGAICVLAGVIIEPIFTLWLLVYDENISRVQAAQIEAERQRASCIEQAAAWRSLKQDQFKKLHDELSKLPPHQPIQLTYIMFDPESMLFAGQFEYLFAHAPWDVDVRAIAYPGAAPFGIFIPDGDGNEDIKAVQRAFTNANIDFSKKDTPPENNTMGAGVIPVPPFKVKILVGSKMPPFTRGTCDIMSMTSTTPAIQPRRRRYPKAPWTDSP